MTEPNKKRPGLTALFTAAVAVWVVYGMATATEPSGLFISVMDWILLVLCVIGCATSILQMRARR